jgi:crotonobetainyl-CoA:carnitine CoA-transferase CaiB-like acyl-CoA transferase
MLSWCANRTKVEALEELARDRIPACPLNTVQEAIDDPHVRATGLLAEVDFPGLPRPGYVVRTPITLTETPLVQPGRAPVLGEHTEVVMKLLRYTPEEISRLKLNGVI